MRTCGRRHLIHTHPSQESPIRVHAVPFTAATSVQFACDRTSRHESSTIVTTAVLVGRLPNASDDAFDRLVRRTLRGLFVSHEGSLILPMNNVKLRVKSIIPRSARNRPVIITPPCVYPVKPPAGGTEVQQRVSAGSSLRRHE
jgi:hypothetical protein